MYEGGPSNARKKHALMHDYFRASMLLQQRAVAQREVRLGVLARRKAAADDDFLTRLDSLQLGRPQNELDPPLGVLGWVEGQAGGLAVSLHGHLARDLDEL